MILDIPIFRNQEVTDWLKLCLNLPTCVKRETAVSTVYKCFSEREFIEFSVLKDETFRLVNVPHDKHTDFQADSLGIIYERVGMLKNNYSTCEVEELTGILNRYNTLIFNISHHLQTFEL